MSDEEEADRAAIFARRKRWIALAMAGAAAAVTTACAQPCLSPTDVGLTPRDAGPDAGPDAREIDAP